ncbi:cyclin-like protein [Zopfia rhizophila CBS 207.26]|uniref:RNA polymerase II holoenzyme cyclin-like subunit n=1 Tax=Zopfia rhizophila CBS 207.26 TaxID=1314779 RepID=A0A6A6DQ69_9PEZI|nr:cyclin-like protein [Zopfia rhizophila CBS 207.26]
MKLTEDDLYRSSTQFKHWSFTPEQLASQRLKTNITASERVKAAVKRQRAQRLRQQDTASTSESERNGSGIENGGNTPIPMDKEVNCLTVAEEQKLVNTFCERAIDLGTFFKFPTEVIATGVQYLRRFYLYNSPMTYEPQTISRSAMFIANKTEGHHLTLEKYAAGLTKTSTEQVLAPEYLIVQALRFHFDVRHPFRGLKGGHLEMVEMAKGNAAILPTLGKSAKELQAEMQKLPRKAGGPPTNTTIKDLEKRVTEAYGHASHILKTAAILTDSYFLYTPSQTWLSAHLLADEPLTHFYISSKFPPPATSNPTYTKLLSKLRECAALLSSHRSFTSSSTSKEEKEAREKKEQAEVQQLIKKLRHCRDPDKMDLVKLNKAQKRDAAEGGQLEESKAKRRKLEREGYQKEADEFWGPELPKMENGAKAN